MDRASEQEKIERGRWLHERYAGDFCYRDDSGRLCVLGNVDMDCLLSFSAFSRDQERQNAMADLEGFDAAEVDPNVGFDLVPAGWYPAVIVASEMSANKSGTGKFLKLTWQVTQGPQQNRKIFQNLNLHNPNQEAVKIARGELSAICRAVGVMTPKDSAELHMRPAAIQVKVSKSKDAKYGDQNIVRGCVSLNEKFPPGGFASSTTAAATPKAPVASSDNRKPWN